MEESPQHDECKSSEMGFRLPGLCWPVALRMASGFPNGRSHCGEDQWPGSDEICLRSLREKASTGADGRTHLPQAEVLTKENT